MTIISANSRKYSYQISYDKYEYQIQGGHRVEKQAQIE